MKKEKKHPHTTWKQEEFDSTSSSLVYRRILQQRFPCERCSAGHRHNCSLYHHPIRNWKRYRKTQYRE